MKRTTRVKIMLIVVFACAIYWLNSLTDNLSPESLPNAAPAAPDATPGGAQEIWPTDNPDIPAASED